QPRDLQLVGRTRCAERGYGGIKVAMFDFQLGQPLAHFILAQASPSSPSRAYNAANLPCAACTFIVDLRRLWFDRQCRCGASATESRLRLRRSGRKERSISYGFVSRGSTLRQAPGSGTQDPRGNEPPGPERDDHSKAQEAETAHQGRTVGDLTRR